MITSLLYDAGTLNILKFKGRKTVPLTDTFWDECREYAGMCDDDTTDFCLIYDKKPILNEALMSTQCESTDCIWSRNKIYEAVKVLEVTEPTEIRNENGMLLVKAGCFLNVRKEDIVKMTAEYRKADKDTEEAEELLEQMTAQYGKADKDKEETEVLPETPLIKYYKRELQEYKEGYESQLPRSRTIRTARTT